jgi:hypothetical protein
LSAYVPLSSWFSRIRITAWSPWQLGVRRKRLEKWGVDMTKAANLQEARAKRDAAARAGRLAVVLSLDAECLLRHAEELEEEANELERQAASQDAPVSPISSDSPVQEQEQQRERQQGPVAEADDPVGSKPKS